MKRTLAAAALLCLLLPCAALAQRAQKAKKADARSAKEQKEKKKDEKKEVWSSDTFAGLELRAIGPALTSGRVIDLAMHPTDRSTYYVAVASGGVWKTTNGGATYEPIFDGEGSYSIGCVTLDPNDPLVVWVGTGENNSQRSVGYGDGVYKSVDGGKRWKKMGLGASEHIGKILVDPRNSKVVWVAAQGPLWSPGGDRGLYKTTDGGATWKQVLAISENTGVSDIAFDPRDPDVVYATAYQRRRHVWTLIDGGPESAIHKTRDGGATWEKLTNGLPKEEMGRIGIAVSPVDPNVVYAIIEAAAGAGGFFRSLDAGANWEKRNDYVSGSPQYYQELFADPKEVGRVYSMDVFTRVTEDGGKTWSRLGEEGKHVDNHALWIDPEDTDHLLQGCDGGIYETFDRGRTWIFKPNLPVTQFYKIAVDNATPFYNVYGGTQDNNTLGGPSRTRTDHGITNADWFVTVGGDGFQPRVDPEDPDVVYSQWQYGQLVRFDKKSGEVIDIQPQAGRGEPPLRFNWDSPLIISPHSRTRLYFAAQRVFRTDDRGDSWRPVSPDLTRGVDRNKLKVMGRVWPIDAVAKNASTSFFGNIVALSESPLKEGLLYVGTDDGLVQVSEDGGTGWQKLDRFPGVPDMTYVARVDASLHDADTVYAAFDNHKMGDFKPYLLKSTDRGRSWTSIAGDLPARGSVYAFAEDHVDRDLLFAGTEFGVYFTRDGGKRWVELSGGMPTIAVRDLAIQKRENDLVVGTFGRGIYILDDYTPLRRSSPALLEGGESVLFPVERTTMFIPWQPLGEPGKASQGEAYYTAPNPPFGAVFTYYLKEDYKSRKKMRLDAQKELEESGGEIAYPDWSALREEAREDEPAIVITVTDQEGNVVRRLTGPATAGFHRVAWDLRFPPAVPVSLEEQERSRFGGGPEGPLVAPGTFRVTLAKRIGGQLTPLGEAQAFTAEPLGIGGGGGLPADQRTALAGFQRETTRLQRAVLGAIRAADEAQTRIDHLEKAVAATPGISPEIATELDAIENRLADLRITLEGDEVVDDYNEPTPPSIVGRVQSVVFGHWSSSGAATQSHRDALRIAGEDFAPLLGQLQQLVEVDLRGIEERMEAAGAPWTPGRVPRWQPASQ